MTLGDILIIVAVLGAALSCPAMMWFQNRRGRSAACCPPAKDNGRIHAADLGALRRRQEEIETQLAKAHGARQAGTDPHSHPAG